MCVGHCWTVLALGGEIFFLKPPLLLELFTSALCLSLSVVVSLPPLCALQPGISIHPSFRLSWSSSFSFLLPILVSGFETSRSPQHILPDDGAVFSTSQLQTFNTPAPCRTVEELTTGAAISQALHKIDPAWFTDGWLGRIKTDVEDNWRLKVQSSVLGQEISDFPLPDLALVAEHSNPVELGRLLQLILGCAVRCERKQEYIQIIMTLEESVQHVVMTAIQELMSKETMAPFGAELSGDLEQQLKKALEDLTELLAEKEALAQRCQELDIQVAVLQEERNSLLAENDVLTDRANQLDTFDDPSTPSGRKHSQLQQQLETLQEENFRLEAAKDDYRIHCEELEKQLIEVQHRNDELTSLAEESRALKDELDVLRNCSDRVVMLEASVETYKRKLENLGDLKRQMKLLEENNMTYMHNTVSLEEELRKANAARAQLETYKRQVQELHRKLSEETRIIIERDSLKEINEELRCTQAQQHQLSQAGMLSSGSPSHDNLAAELIPIEYREKFIRLQHENKMLRVQQEECEREKIAALQAQLEEAHKTRSELDTENRLSREQVSELQQQVEDLQKALQSQAAKPDDVSVPKPSGTNTEKMVQLNEAQDEIMKKKELLEDLQPDNTQTSLKVDELMAALKKKDDDMRAMEERYKMYLEKARNVIRALDPKLNPATAEIQALRNQLADRDKQILSLEEVECRNAAFRLPQSLNFQKLAIESRLGGRTSSVLSPGQSFLSQQRQVSNAPRRALSISVPATTSK
uniref:Hook microtubule-tethering protein 1 n=1 Tax=Lates calcarifer TaxID=8187 RepID=A0A4W6D331_LATCA